MRLFSIAALLIVLSVSPALAGPSESEGPASAGDTERTIRRAAIENSRISHLVFEAQEGVDAAARVNRRIPVNPRTSDRNACPRRRYHRWMCPPGHPNYPQSPEDRRIATLAMTGRIHPLPPDPDPIPPQRIAS